MILSPQDMITRYTEEGWWGTQTLDDLFNHNLDKHPEAEALVDPANRAELLGTTPLRFSYSELDQAINRFCMALLKAGVSKDDVVMVQLPNIAELVIAYLATARIGAIISPLPVQYRTHEIRQMIALTEPRVYITTKSFDGFNFVEMVQGLKSDAVRPFAIMAVGDDLPEDVVSIADVLGSSHDQEALSGYLAKTTIDANDCYTICWTSGTEADPKGVPRSHNMWIAIAYFTVDGASLAMGDTLLNPFPLVNMSGIGGMLVPWLITGGKMVMHHPLNLPVFLSQIGGEKVNYTVCPPVLLNLLLLRPALLESADLSTIKNLGSGSAPLSPWMVSEWKSRHGINVLNFFGANEGTALVSNEKDMPDPEERATYFPRFGVAGFDFSVPIAKSIETKIVDPLTKEVITEPGKMGELALKGSTVFAGYYKRSDLTETAFDPDGFFYTGDLFEIAVGEDDTLNRYRFVGRLKDVIIRGGMTISSEEIEVLLQSHPKVQDVAVVGYIDGRILEEEIITAVIVPKEGQEITLTELVDHLKEKDIANYKYPKKLLIKEMLPRNPVGKVLKRDLREELKSLSAKD